MRAGTRAISLLMFGAGLCGAAGAAAGQVFPWAHAFGGAGSETANDCVRTDGGYFLAGFTNSVGMGGLDLWVARLDERGRALWQVALGGRNTDEAHELVATSDGGCIVAGQTDSFGAGASDGWIIKLDAQGGVEWQKTYGGAGFEGFSTIARSPRGYYVGGSLNMQQGDQDVWVLEIDVSGEIIWQEMFEGNQFDQMASVASTPSGLVFVANSNSDLADRPANVPFHRPWLMALDPDGQVLWSRTYNLSGGDLWNHITPTRDGGYVATGEALAAAFFRGDFWIVRLDATGNIIWDQRFGDNFGNLHADFGMEVFETTDGGFLAAGSTNTGGAGSQDVWLIKVDSAGGHQWDRTYGMGGFDSGQAMALNEHGQALVAGAVQLVSPQPFDGLGMLVNPDGSLIANCGLAGEGEPNIWTSQAEITEVKLTPTPTEFGVTESNAGVVMFEAGRILCGPPLLRMRR